VESYAPWIKRLALLSAVASLGLVPAVADAHVLSSGRAKAAAQAHANRLAGRPTDVYMLSRIGVFREGHAHTYYAQAGWQIPSPNPTGLTRYCFVEMNIRIASSRRAVVRTRGAARCSTREDADPQPRP
jgi:hypothetical protein